MPEDVIQLTEEEDGDMDDSEVTVKTVIKSIVGGELSNDVASRPSGALMLITAAESMATSPVVSGAEPPAQHEASTEERGRGKHKKIKNRMYNEEFWQHNDSGNSDIGEGM